MIGKEDIGRESEATLVEVQPERVRRYAEAIGIPYDHRVPPTFVATLCNTELKGLGLPMAGSIHGEQSIEYVRPIQEGEQFICKRRIKDVYERVGRLGKMTIVIVETLGYDLAGETIFSCRSTLIIPNKEGVK
jgi:hypothetical protein